MALETAEFRRLIETHQRMVYSLALRILGEAGAAEEVAQDVFLEMFRCAEGLQSEEHVRFWLRRVTLHRSTDALRRRALRPETNAEEWLEEEHAGGTETGAGAGVIARLEELLRAMPESLRIPVVLRYQEEMLPGEIATLLNQPLATVKSNLQRGLKLLRRKAAVTMKGYVRGSA